MQTSWQQEVYELKLPPVSRVINKPEVITATPIQIPLDPPHRAVRYVIATYSDAAYGIYKETLKWNPYQAMWEHSSFTEESFRFTYKRSDI